MVLIILAWNCRYDIFKVIFRQYHEHMAFMLDCMGASADSLANSDILKVAPCCTFLGHHDLMIGCGQQAHLSTANATRREPQDVFHSYFIKQLM